MVGKGIEGGATIGVKLANRHKRSAKDELEPMR